MRFPKRIRHRGQILAAASAQPSAGERHEASNQAATTSSSNTASLLNTDGPVTTIAVSPGELAVETPGVISTTEMGNRLEKASAKGADIQISLFWKNFNDLVLRCIDPKGEEVYYGNKKSSRTGGELDVDQNAYISGPQA
ncbi:MAG: hypothetical protein ABSA47_07280 [Verrucomicrobiota bacterium]|jgi:hypothetical protein